MAVARTGGVALNPWQDGRDRHLLHMAASTARTPQYFMGRAVSVWRGGMYLFFLCISWVLCFTDCTVALIVVKTVPMVETLATPASPRSLYKRMRFPRESPSAVFHVKHD